MYPKSFQYHRASSLKEAGTMLAQLGDEAKLLAGGQSLIPLMKLRFANPKHLVDLTFIPGTSYIKEDRKALHFGALTRHAEIENSAVAAKIPIIHDCAAGIADVQIRNRGTIGGSIAEAAEAARAASDPQPDMRGSADYKRSLVSALVKRALGVAARRARGEQVEVTHIYA